MSFKTRLSACALIRCLSHDAIGFVQAVLGSDPTTSTGICVVPGQSIADLERILDAGRFSLPSPSPSPPCPLLTTRNLLGARLGCSSLTHAVPLFWPSASLQVIRVGFGRPNQLSNLRHNTAIAGQLDRSRDLRHLYGVCRTLSRSAHDFFLPTPLFHTRIMLAQPCDHAVSIIRVVSVRENCHRIVIIYYFGAL